MGFFDLNIPYHESSKPTKPNTRLKQTRINLAAKSMELGYTGIAYGRTIAGVMSDNDFCAISPLPLSSLVKLSPSFPSSVKLHREALGVPLSSPFRQYTRLTVVVDNAAQATALNSGNPILRTYDLVAIRPMNQTAFEQACLVSEVDIIAIDFSENKLFRLRQPMVKAAIQRGIYFEITYSDLLADARTRRRVIDNAKLLVNWTRGKNLIFSSAAPSVNELRGPYDVANLMSLLGVSMERAKAAISKNCRSLIANALRRKQCYKEAIRVEVIPDEQVDPKKLWYGDWLNYDPISSGEGDLLLEDMAKSFSASNKVIKTVKAIDFASVMDNIPSHGLQLNDLISGAKGLRSLDDGRNFVSAAKVVEVSAATNEVSEQPRTDQILLTTPLSNPFCEHTTKSFSPKNIPEECRNAQESGTHTTIMEDETKISNGLHECFAAPIEKDVHDLLPQDHGPRSKLNDVIQEPSETHQRMVMDVELDVPCTLDASAPLMNYSSLQVVEHERSINSDVILGAENVVVDGVSSEIESNDRAKLPLASSSSVPLNNYIVEGEQVKVMRDEVFADERLNVDFYDDVEGKDGCSVATGEKINEVTIEEQDQGEDHTENFHPTLDKSIAGEQVKDLGEDEVLLSDERLLVESYDDVEGKDGCSVANGEQIKDVTMKEQDQGDDHTEIYYPTLDESTAGKVKGKQRTPNRAFMLPFKRLLNPVPFKKKARKFKRKIKLV